MGETDLEKTEVENHLKDPHYNYFFAFFSYGSVSMVFLLIFRFLHYTFNEKHLTQISNFRNSTN